MSQPLSSATDWPDSLEWILSDLQRTSTPQIIETQMDAGPPKRRRAGPDVECFVGTVQLDEEEFSELMLLSHVRFIRIKMTNPDGEFIVSFREPPRSIKTTIVVGGATSRDVQIQLAINPHSSKLLGHK